MNRYKVIVVGMGKRGQHHASAFHANSRFELVGICDHKQPHLEAIAPKLGNPRISTDARTLAKEVKPDIFCFCTSPKRRLSWYASRIPAIASRTCFIASDMDFAWKDLSLMMLYTICATVRILARGWISFCEMTMVCGRKRSMIERT